MSLRLKLFLPLLLLASLLTAYVGVYGLPQFRSGIEMQQREQLRQQLAGIAEGLTAQLEQGRRSSVGRRLDALLENNPAWSSIELFDARGVRLYPAKASARSGSSPGAVFYTLEQGVGSAGRLILVVDETVNLQAVGGLQRYFLIAFMAVMLILAVAAAVALELGIHRPVKRLSEACARVAKGDFLAPLPWPSTDEIGVLAGTFAFMRDAIQQYQSDLSFQATHDPLTSLLNRREFERRLTIMLNTTKVERSQHALLYMDLDQFKVVNDTCGHTAGDEYLRQLSVILHGRLRKHDTLARLGGDEFGILLEHCPADHATRIASEMLVAIQDFRFVWEGNSFTLGASIGLVFINEYSESLSRILSVADAACYAAKDAGRNRIHVYRDDDSTLVRRHGEMQWVSRITDAIKDGRFHLYYQLIVPVGSQDDEGVHFEFLLRMEDKTGKIVAPGAFLHAAERYNMMISLDRWVVQTAFDWLERHPERMARLKLSTINLSGHSLGDPDFMQFVLKLLNRGGLPAEKICFEITETAAVGNLARATRFMSILKNLGCRFSLDDFGSGMSSFAYLKNLPVDYLKIDGLFVKDIADDPIDFAMVKSINEMGHVMGKHTVAEFVERDAVLLKLKEIGVDYAQGFCIAKPRPLIEMDSTFIREHLQLVR